MGNVQQLLKTLKQVKRDESGQDMIEYALMAAALVVIVAGFLPPTIAPAISTIFSKISSTLGLV